MSKKAKYKAHPDAMNPGLWFVESPRDIICQRCTYTGARKIARALNAMEDKTKVKAWKFDWSGIPERFKWAAMDDDFSWWIYAMKPCTGEDAFGWYANDDDEMHAAKAKGVLPYPGDWRDSLQQRP